MSSRRLAAGKRDSTSSRMPWGGGLRSPSSLRILACLTPAAARLPHQSRRCHRRRSSFFSQDGEILCRHRTRYRHMSIGCLASHRVSPSYARRSPPFPDCATPAFTEAPAPSEPLPASLRAVRTAGRVNKCREAGLLVLRPIGQQAAKTCHGTCRNAFPEACRSEPPSEAAWTASGARTSPKMAMRRIRS